MSRTAERNPEVRELLERKYRHGFVTDIESDTLPPGLDEDVIRVISARKDEPEFLLDWRLRAYRYWREAKEPCWAKLNIPPIDYQAISYYSAPGPAKDAPKSLGRSGPAASRDLRQAGHSAARTGPPGRRGGGRRVRQRVGGHHLQESPGRGRRDFLLLLRGGARTPGTGAQVPGQRGAVPRQLLRGAEFGGVYRRLVRLHSEAHEMPDGVVHVLPHQRAEHGPVRAHPDRRRRRQRSQLPGRLHCADARRKPVACRRGGTGRG